MRTVNVVNKGLKSVEELDFAVSVKVAAGLDAQKEKPGSR
jgi:hypothetical protein